MWFFKKRKTDSFPPFRWSPETAVKLPLTVDDAGIFQFARQWIAALEAGDYQGALEMTYPHERDQGRMGIEWLKALITHHGSLKPLRSGVSYHVTSPREASGALESRRSLEPDPDDDEGRGSCDPEFPIGVYRFNEPPENNPFYLGTLHVHLPLNGQWSHLTAVFDILRKEQFIVFKLIDVEVQ